MIGRVSWDGRLKKNKNEFEWTEHKQADAQKQNGYAFKDCILIDQSKLIDWINDDLDTTVWFLKELNALRRSTQFGLISIERRLEDFRQRFSIGVDPKILTVEQPGLQRLAGKLSGLGICETVYGNSGREAAVAACETINSSSELEDRPKIVTSTEAGIEQLENTLISHIVVVEGEAANHAHRLSNHSVVVARAILTSPAQSGGIVLQRPSVDNFFKHLDVADATQDPKTIAKAVGRTISALERGYSDPTNSAAPWADYSLPEHDLLCKLVLFGAWSEKRAYDHATQTDKYGYQDIELIKTACSENDFNSIQSLTKRFGRRVGKAYGACDPLFARGNSLLNLTAPVDAFYRFAPAFTDKHFNLLEQALATVLDSRAKEKHEPDEPFNLAEYNGYSDALVGGLILSFVLVGLLAGQRPLDLTIKGEVPSEWCKRVYQKAIPQLHNHPQFAASISTYYSLLAEGVPDPFLMSLEQLIGGHQDVVRDIFQTRRNKFSMHDYHLGNDLLWALERIAWKPEYLPRAACILLELHRIGKPWAQNIGNNPLSSLHQALSTFCPQTSANTQERLAVYEKLAVDFKVDALDIFLELLDQHGSVLIAGGKPLFGRYEEPQLTYGDVYAAKDKLVELTLDIIEGNPGEVGRVIEIIPNMKDDVFARAVKLLSGISPNSSQSPEIVEQLRRFVGHHSQFPDADWSLPESRLAPLRKVMKKIEPKDARKHLWLFGKDWIDLYEEPRLDNNNKLGQLRLEAMPHLMSDGNAGLIEFASQSGSAGLVGVAAGRYLDDCQAALQLIQSASVQLSKERYEDFVRSISLGMGLERSDNWLKFLRTNAEAFTAKQFKLIGEGLPPEDNIIKEIVQKATWHDNLYDGFWSNFNVFRLFHLSSPEAAIDALLGVSRAHDLAVLFIKDQISLSDEIVGKIVDNFQKDLLEHLSQGRQMGDMTLNNYWKLLEAVERRKIKTLEEIAGMEFPFAARFRFGGPDYVPAIHRVLAKNPAEFVEIVKMLYRPDQVDSPKETKEIIKEPEVQEHMVTASYHVLSTMKFIPGQSGTNIDETELANWLLGVRSEAKKVKRTKAVEITIGELFGHAPIDPVDQMWPHQTIRNVLEQHSSADLIRNMKMSEFNSRGVFSGSTESHYSTSAEKYRQWAKSMKQWPRTQQMLYNMATNDEGWAETGRKRRKDNQAAHGMR